MGGVSGLYGLFCNTSGHLLDLLSDVRYAETDSATQVNVRVKDGKKFVHDGIRIELIGSIGRLHQPIPE
jgi:hypothetical protein